MLEAKQKRLTAYGEMHQGGRWLKKRVLYRAPNVLVILQTMPVYLKFLSQFSLDSCSK